MRERESNQEEFRSKITYRPNDNRIDAAVKVAYVHRPENVEPLAGRDLATDRYVLLKLIKDLMEQYEERELMLEPQQFQIAYGPRIEAIAQAETGNLDPLLKLLATELESELKDILDTEAQRKVLGNAFSDNPELLKLLDKFDGNARIFGVGYKAFSQSLQSKALDPRMLNLFTEYLQAVKVSSASLEANVTASEEITYDDRSSLIDKLGMIQNLCVSLSFLQKLLYPKTEQY